MLLSFLLQYKKQISDKYRVHMDKLAESRMRCTFICSTHRTFQSFDLDVVLMSP